MASPLPPVQTFGTNIVLWVKSIATTLNAVVGGRMNVTGTVTLTPSATTTTLTDSRISFSNYIALQPTTAHASTAFIAGIWFSNQTTGSVTLNHASSANTDQTFTYVIVG